jgi:hypothetical protein
MRLRYFQAEDPFAAASERSERAFNEMCLPPPPALSGADADADAMSASSCAASGLARQVCDAMAPQQHAEVVVDSRPQAAFQAAMAKARAGVHARARACVDPRPACASLCDWRRRADAARAAAVRRRGSWCGQGACARARAAARATARPPGLPPESRKPSLTRENNGRRLNAMGRLLRADWWFAGAAAAVDYTLGVPLPRGEPEEAEDVPQFEEPVLLCGAAAVTAESCPTLAPVRRVRRAWVCAPAVARCTARPDARRGPLQGEVFAAAARGVGAAPAPTTRAGDDDAAAALRAALDVTPRRVPLPPAADDDDAAAAQRGGDALLAHAAAPDNDDSGSDDASFFEAEPLACMPPADAFVPPPPPAQQQAAGALLLELLSTAAAAPADAAATPPEVGASAAADAAAGEHSRACALLRSLAPDAPPAPQQPAAPPVLQLRYHDDKDDDARPRDTTAGASGADVAMADSDGDNNDNYDDAAEVDGGVRVFTLEQCAVSDVGSGSSAGALMAFAEAQRPCGGSGGSGGTGALLHAARALPPPPPRGAARAAAPARRHGEATTAAAVEEHTRVLRGALLHALIIAPALTPSAHHSVPMLPAPFVRDPSPPPAAALLPLRGAAPAPLAAAELRLRWGADGAMAPPPALRRRMARPEPAPPAEGAAAAAAAAAMEHDGDAAPPGGAHAMLQMLDADAARGGGGDGPTTTTTQRVTPPAEQEEPQAPLPAPPPPPPVQPAARDEHADVPMRLVAPRGAGGAPGGSVSAPAPAAPPRVLPTSLDADLAAFVRRAHRLSAAAEAGSSELGGAAAGAAGNAQRTTTHNLPPPPPLREHVVELPAEPHARLWRALRAAASGVAVREVARHDARDAAALLDAGGADLGALQARVRALAAGGARAEPHVRALAAACVLLGAADTLAQAGLRAAHAYLEGALRAAPPLALGALGAAAAPARGALDAAVAALDDAPGRGAMPPLLPDAAVTDHPKARRRCDDCDALSRQVACCISDNFSRLLPVQLCVLRHVLSRVDALAPAATVAVVADARALLPLHAAVCALNLRPYQARAHTHLVHVLCVFTAYLTRRAPCCSLCCVRSWTERALWTRRLRRRAAAPAARCAPGRVPRRRRATCCCSRTRSWAPRRRSAAAERH